MKYQVWDSVSYGHMEPLVPFTKLFESEELKEAVEFVESYDDKVVLFVTYDDGRVLFDTTMSIFESPDGKIIYKRLPLSTKRTKIN